MSLPSAICLSPSSKARQKLGFLRDLLEFLTRKFWQLGHDFVKTRLQILRKILRRIQRRRQQGRVTALEGAIQIVITPHHRDSIVQRAPKRNGIPGSILALPLSFSTLKAGSGPAGRHPGN